MRGNKRILLVLFVILCLGLAVSFALGKYTEQWEHGFGLLISPVEQDETDTTLRRYFRSNELLPASEGKTYTVNGTSGWFTVANALDASTVSEDTVNYTLTWYISADGSTWTEHKKENGSFGSGEYHKAKYTVEPITLNATVYNHVKVCGETSSFLQEDIEAVYTLVYANYTVDMTCADGAITVKIDTNDVSGDFKFTWPEGIVPDNSDPNKIFTNALTGPSKLTATLNRNTAYEFLFFVTDDTLLDGSSDVTNIIGINKE